VLHKVAWFFANAADIKDQRDHSGPRLAQQGLLKVLAPLISAVWCTSRPFEFRTRGTPVREAETEGDLDV
jgi:hypothetical protein